MDKFNWASFGAGLVAANIAVAWAYIAHYIRSSKGHYVPTISTALETRRSRITSALSGQSEDDLIVFINLKKEEESQAVTLKALCVEVFQLDRNEARGVSALNNEQHPNPENRSLDSAGKLISTRNVFAIWTSQKKRPLNLAPREATQYASHHVVRTGEVYEVVVTLTAVRYRSWITRPFYREDCPKDLLFYTSSIISTEATADA